MKTPGINEMEGRVNVKQAAVHPCLFCIETLHRDRAAESHKIYIDNIVYI